MSAKLAVLKAALSQLAGLGRRVIPMSEEVVMNRVRGNAGDIAKSIIEKGGVSFSPRLNRLFTPEDYGHMMSVINEPLDRLPVEATNVDDVTRKVIEAAKNPLLMKRLRRGENFGGWVDENAALALDPSVRHLNRDVSILRGARAKQDSGYSLMGGKQYDLTDELKREALRRLLAEVAAGGGAAATGGYLGAQD